MNPLFLRMFIISLFLCMIFSFLSNAEIEYLGSVGGVTSDVVILENPAGWEGCYAYVAQGACIVVLDVSDYENPIVLKRLYPAAESIRNLSISGARLVAAVGGSGAYLYSLAAPDNPQLLAILPLSAADEFREVHEARLCGSTLALIDRSWGQGGPTSARRYYRRLYNISDIHHPITISYVSYSSHIGHTNSDFLYSYENESGDWNFFWYNSGYYPTFYSWIRESSTTSIQLSGGLEDPPVGMFVYQEKIVAAFANHISAYTISNESVVSEIASVTIPNIVGAPLLDGDHGYVPILDGLVAIDVIHPDSIQIEEALPLSFQPRVISNDVAYGILGEEGLVITKLHGSNAGKVNHFFPDFGSAKHAAWNGSELAVMTNAWEWYPSPSANEKYRRGNGTISLLKPLQDHQFELLSQITFHTPPGPILLTDRDLLTPILSDNQFVFQIYNIENPKQPDLISHLPIPDVSFDPDRNLSAAAVNRFLYIINSILRIYSLVDLHDISLQSTFDLENETRATTSFAIANQYLYYHKNNNVFTIDLRDPFQPQYFGRFNEEYYRNQSFSPDDVLSSDNHYLFYADNYYDESTIHIFDLKNPTWPSIVSSFEIAPNSYGRWDSKVRYTRAVEDITPQDSYLWILTSDANMLAPPYHPFKPLVLVDISDPFQQKELAQWKIGREVRANGVVMNDLYLLPADQGGLYVFRISDSVISCSLYWPLLK
ncbi:MAG: hypothetical protein C4527_11785 [Candidatus Omnitrophota bacterium]|nr:MAG: hypothetical protein C4527_11785 [Candidatus Omnitrophota bacterium]